MERIKTLFLIFIFTIFLNILFIQTSNAQWVQQTNGLPESWITGWAIDACDSNTAVFLVNLEGNEPDAVFHTTDGGNSWNNITPFKIWGETGIDVSIIDKDHIWLATSAVDSARILHTADGGETWTVQFNDPSKTKFFNYIEMFDENNGIAMGDAPNWGETVSDENKALFLRTNDGGENWNIMENNKPIYASGDTWRRLDFASMDIGYFNENYSGHENQGIMKTHDGGNNWNVLIPDIGIRVMKFYNEDIGLVITSRYDSVQNRTPVMYRTIDGGNSWTDYIMDFDVSGSDIEFMPDDPSHVWLLDFRGLFFSSDTGKTWIKNDSTDINPSGTDIVFVDDEHGWILDYGGKLYYTNNNGGIITDVKNDKKEVLPTEFKLFQNYPNPFNPSTTISYSLPLNGFVKLNVYDLLGREVESLVNKEQPSGNYKVEFNASSLTSGIYFYKLECNGFSKTSKLILLK